MAMRITKRIKREVNGRRRMYTIELERAGLRIREKGRRTSYLVGWDEVFSLGARLHATKWDC